jgi:hypothetical protein
MEASGVGKNHWPEIRLTTPFLKYNISALFKTCSRIVFEY